MAGSGVRRWALGLAAAALMCPAAVAGGPDPVAQPPGTFLHGAELSRAAAILSLPEAVGVRVSHLRITLSAPGRRPMHLRLALAEHPGAVAAGRRGAAFVTAPGQEAAIARFLQDARGHFAGIPARITVHPEGAFCALGPVPHGPLPVRFEVWAGDRPLAALRHDLRARAPLGAMGRDLRHPCPSRQTPGV